MANFQKVKTNYQKKTLSEVVDFIDGDRGANYPSQGEFFPSGYCLFLSTKNVPNRKFSFEEKMFIDEEKNAVLRKGKLQRGDYVLTTRGTVGNFAYYDKNVPFENIRINSGMVILRKKTDELDEKFFRYYLSSSSFSEQVKSRVSGSAQPQLPIRDMISMEIILPNPETQTRIASVLSAYDDLIENNEKRIKALEEMAQLLYTEWFVKFKFPGSSCAKASADKHEKVKMIDSKTEYGMVPEGWEVKKLSEISSVVRGCSYSSEEINDFIGDYYIVNLKSFNRGGGFRFDGEKYYSGIINDNQSLETGDIVVAVTDMTTDRAVIARPARVPEINGKITFSADVVKINSDILPNSFLYQLLLSHSFTETTKQKANGANVLHLKPSAILEFVAPIPETQLLKMFDVLCEPIAREIDKLLKQNQNLSKTRDLLIPQLVTGRRELK